MSEPRVADEPSTGTSIVKPSSVSYPPASAAGKARAVACGPAAKGRVAAAEVRCLDLTGPVGRRRLVCAGFCTFFKPASPAEDRCAGLAEFERLLAEVWSDPAAAGGLLDALAELVDSAAPVSYEWDDALAVLVCRACPYRPEGGCDHRDPTLDAEVRLEPCGGYILLAALADRGAITLVEERE